MKKTLLSTLIAGLCIASHATHAQQAGFLAEVDSRLTYEDNILRASDANAESDTSLVVAPKLTLAGILGKQRFSATYQGEYAKYFDNSEVDYTDHDIRLRADFDHSPRLTSRFNIQYRDVHEDFNDLNNISDGLSEFNRYDERLISGRLAYGRQDSFGQLVFRLGRTERDYTNNDQEFRSSDRDTVALAFYYRIAPRTRLLSEVIVEDYSYNPDNGFVDLDNQYVRYLIGVEWVISNKLEGAIKAGYQDRDYELDVLQDIDGLSYEADLEWSINTYSVIDVSARRESLSSSLDSVGGVLRTSYDLGLTHEFTPLIHFKGLLGYSKDELVAGLNREDTRNHAEAGVKFGVSRITELGLNFTFEERESTFELAEYDVSSINFTAKIIFD